MPACPEPGRPLAIVDVEDCPVAGLPCAEVEVDPDAPMPVEDWLLEPCAEMLPEDEVSERNASLPLVVDDDEGDCVCREPLVLVERFCAGLWPGCDDDWPLAPY